MVSEMKRIRFGTHEFDPVTGELFRDGQIVKLQPQPSRVLSLLLAHPGEVLSREELREALWPDGTTVEFDQGLNYCIRQIRAALGESASDPDFIETIPKKGYRFIAAIESSAEEAGLPVHSLAPRRIRRPLLAGAVALFLLFMAWTWYSDRGVAQPKTLLVQAFVPLGMAEGESWYGDALAQRLIANLAKADGIRVLPWSAAASLRGQKLSGIEAGKQQGADAVLEASVRRRDRRLILTAQLIDVESERVVWSFREDREANNLEEIEDTVTASLARALRFRLVEGEAPLARRLPEDPETYNLYLKGMALNDRMTPDATAAAVEAFEEVIRRKPSFAPTYVGLANVLVLATFTRKASKESNIARALELADRALALDPEFAGAHGAKAHAFFNAWNWVEADREFQMALRLDPNSATTLQLYGVFLGTQERFDEAVRALQRAEELAPTSGLIASTQCRVAFHAQRYEEAIASCKRALLIDPARHECLTLLGRIHVLKGMPKEAQRYFVEARKPNQAQSEGLWRAYGAAAMGDSAGARAELLAWEKLPKESKFLPLPYGLAKLRLKEERDGLAVLRKLVEARLASALWLRSTPELQPYRDDPRLQEILAQVASPPSPRPAM